MNLYQEAQPLTPSAEDQRHGTCQRKYLKATPGEEFH